MIGALRVLRRAVDGLYWLTGVLAALCLISICAIMMVLSVGREIDFNLRGGDEIGAWLCASCAFLGSAYTFRAGEVIRVGLLIDRLTGRAAQVAEILALSFSAIIIGSFAWFVTLMVWESYRYNEYAQGILAIPIWIPQSGMAIGIVVFFISVVDELIVALRGGKPSYIKPPPQTPEEVIERAAQSGV